MGRRRSTRRRAVARVAFAATLATVAARARAGQCIKIDKLDDDFTSSVLLTCEACAAVTHGATVYLDRVKQRKQAAHASTDIVDGEMKWADVCESRFGEGTARYGYKEVGGTKMIVGPGIGNFPDILSQVTDAKRVSEQLYARCNAIMYELDDFSLAETYADATNAIERLGGPVEGRPNAIFMKFVEKNCVENLPMCESVKWFKDAMTSMTEKALEENKAAWETLINETVKEHTIDGTTSRSIDSPLAISKCDGSDSKPLPTASCRVFLSELIKKGEQNAASFRNFTGEAKKFESAIARGGQTELDENDEDQDGDVTELRAEAMLNASHIRANITMMRARAYFTHALAVDEEHYVARHNLAFMANSAKNFTEAREHLELLLVKQVARDVDVDTRAESYKLLCEVHYHDGNTNEAVKACEKSIELNQYNFHTLRLLAQLHMVQFFERVQEVRVLPEGEKIHEDQKSTMLYDLSRAKQLFREALILNPVKNEIAQLGMVIYFEQATEEDALGKLTPEQIQVLENARHFCQRRGTEVDSVCSDVLELAGHYMAEKGFVALGNDALQMSLTLDGNRTHLWESLGYGFMTIGKFKLAKITFDRAKSADGAFTLSDQVQELLDRGYDFEAKLEDDRVTASTRWTENRRPNRKERAELEAEIGAKLSAIRGVRTNAHDEL